MRLSNYLPVSPLTSLSKGSKKANSSSEALGDLSEEELDPKSGIVDDPTNGEELVYS